MNSGKRPVGEPRSGQRPAGTRFKQPQATKPAPRATQRSATRVRPSSYAPGSRNSRGSASRTPRRSSHSGSPLAVVAVVAAVVAVVAVIAFFIAPALGTRLFNQREPIEAGLEVSVSIPEGASGDTIASALSEARVIDNPKDYYAAVERLDAAMAIKPGDYLFKTAQDPEDVVCQLVEGPNVAGVKLVVQEGLTVAQTAANVESTYGIPADEFIAQAKASNYVDDYPFLKGAYDDSLEGYLYPKTYSLGAQPSVDAVIRALLDQFKKETAGLELSKGAHGLDAQQIICLASLIERETAVESERPLVASVIYNRLKADMPLQIDAAIVYARGGGSQGVTYADLEIDSPYNVYKNRGLTPGPICSPSISSIKAALQPASTDYLYYVASAAMDGTHRFTSDYDEFLKYRDEYGASL